MSAPIELPEDIVEQVRRQFLHRDQEAAISLLSTFYSDRSNTVQEHERVMKCALGLSGHKVGQLKHFLDEAIIDYRDLIYWYEHPETSRREFLDREKQS